MPRICATFSMVSKDILYPVTWTIGGDAPEIKQLSLVPGAITDASAVLDNNSDTSSRLERVIDLVQGFETPFGLELLSTVHWVIAEEKALTVDEAMFEQTYSWNLRKQIFYHRANHSGL